LITFNNQTLNFTQWSEKTGIPFSVIQSRICKLNWSVKKALTIPARKMKIKTEYNGENLTFNEWGKKLGVAGRTIYSRIYEQKWSLEKALTTYANPNYKRTKKL
jgi:hypothetical protein